MALTEQQRLRLQELRAKASGQTVQTQTQQAPTGINEGVRAAARGLSAGVGDIVGLPEMATAGMEFIDKLVARGLGNIIPAHPSKSVSEISREMGMPTLRDLLPSAEGVTRTLRGALPESYTQAPESAAGKIAEQAIRFGTGGGLFGAASKVGTIPSAITGALSGVTSEGAGQALEAAGLEGVPADIGRFVGGFVPAPAMFRSISGVARGLKGKVPEQALLRTPTSQDIKEQARTAYDVLEKSGVKYVSDDLQNLKKDMQMLAKEEGFVGVLAPKTDAAIGIISNNIDEFGDLSLKQLDQQRKILRRASVTPDEADRYAAEEMIKKLDDFVEKSSGLKGIEDVNELKRARNTWRQAGKIEILEAAQERAALAAEQGQNLSDALRRELLAIVTPRRGGKTNPLTRSFDKSDIALIEKATKADTPELILRALSPLAPQKGLGAATTLLGIGGGAAIGGPVGAMAAPAIGMAARSAQEARAARRAAQLLGEVGLGVKPATTSERVGDVARQKLIKGK